MKCVPEGATDNVVSGVRTLGIHSSPDQQQTFIWAIDDTVCLHIDCASPGLSELKNRFETNYVLFSIFI